MYYSAFTNGFQSTAFQVRWDGTGIVYGGGGYWERVRQAVREREEAERRLAENRRLEDEKRLELEKKEAELLRKRQLDIQAAWLEKEIQAINTELLLIEQQNILIRAMIAFWLQDEEDAYIILMCTV